jgi:Zn-finger nucleic acid-binding protein
MEIVEHAGINVDRCTGCQGIWFDGLEHRDLKKAGGADSLDIGSAKVGRTHDAQVDVACPKCGSKMDTIADKFQHHIHYEVCPQGDGVYFDAGEFRDFVKEDIGDFFKGLLASRRKKS